MFDQEGDDTAHEEEEDAVLPGTRLWQRNVWAGLASDTSCPHTRAAQPLPAASGWPPPPGGLQRQDAAQPQARTSTQLHAHVPHEAEHQS